MQKRLCNTSEKDCINSFFLSIHQLRSMCEDQCVNVTRLHPTAEQSKEHEHFARPVQSDGQEGETLEDQAGDALIFGGHRSRRNGPEGEEAGRPKKGKSQSSARTFFRALPRECVLMIGICFQLRGDEEELFTEKKKKAEERSEQSIQSLEHPSPKHSSHRSVAQYDESTDFFLSHFQPRNRIRTATITRRLRTPRNIINR